MSDETPADPGAPVDSEPQDGGSGDAKRLRLLGVLLVGVVGIVAVVVLAGGGGGEKGFPTGIAPERKQADLGKAAAAGGCEYRKLKVEGPGENRSGTIRYRSNPPHSGNVSPGTVPVGAYPDAPETEKLVHSLLHGRVLIWFDPGLAEADRGALKALYDEDTYHVLIVPREEMPYEVAATAWGRRLTCPKLTDSAFDAVRAFRESFRDKAPEFVP